MTEAVFCPMAFMADPAAALAAAKRLHAATANAVRRGGFSTRPEVDDEDEAGGPKAAVAARAPTRRR